MVCAGMLKILSKYATKEDFEKDSALWQRIDKFFKEILIANINLQTNLNTETVSYDYLSNIGVISQIEALIDQLVRGNEMTVSYDGQQKPVD